MLFPLALSCGIVDFSRSHANFRGQSSIWSVGFGGWNRMSNDEVAHTLSMYRNNTTLIDAAIKRNYLLCSDRTLLE